MTKDEMKNIFRNQITQNLLYISTILQGTSAEDQETALNACHAEMQIIKDNNLLNEYAEYLETTEGRDFMQNMKNRFQLA